jgi:Asp-tRNA(Asn)/Glu-tRNA(Gln) amidotransferase A subunit family amidase
MAFAYTICFECNTGDIKVCPTLPHGKGAHGLPLGVQLVGPMDGDGALLGWARWTSAALDKETAG